MSQLCHSARGQKLSLPDNGGVGAVALHLRQHMAGKENRSALFVPLLKQTVEFPLDEGVQTAGGFVQNVEPGLVLQSADDARFLSVAQGELVNFPVRV